MPAKSCLSITPARPCRSLIGETTTESCIQAPPMRDREVSKRQHESQRLNKLEQENAALRAELNEAKLMLERYTLMFEFMAETGGMPR